MPPASTNASQTGEIQFKAKTAQAAAEYLRQHYRGQARVVAVESVPASGWKGWLGSDELLITARLPEEPRTVRPAAPAAAPASEPMAVTAQNPDPTPGPSLAVAETAPARRPAKVTLPAPVAPWPNLEVVLDRSGFSPSLRRRLQNLPDWAAWQDLPLHQALGKLGGGLVSLQAERRIQLPERVAFLGPAGGGRSTALAKWLTAEVFQFGRPAQVTLVDFDRPESHERLTLHCELLGVPCRRHPAPAETEPARRYYDLPAFAPGHRPELRRLQRFLEEERIEGRVLVLPALYDAGLLRTFCGWARELGATHTVFTHCDTLPSWARLWDFALDPACPILFLGTGPNPAGDCELEVLPALLRRSFHWQDESEVAA